MCVECGARLTTPLSQVALPTHVHQKYGNGLQLPVLMESGTFAVDPEPWGPPWRTWEEIDPDEAEARGIYAPVYALSDGAPGAIAIAPGDAHGTQLIPEKGGGCGLDGADGPHHLFRADPGAFQHTLVRLQAVRSPWLREILENLTQHMRARLF